MAYKALYRKYRPNTFDEVVEQKHIVSTLKNAIKNNKLAHAYLFCGPRGTGKTSIAKILAKTLNCQCEDGDKPCCKCSSCLDIQEGTHPDVIELDAASNNGVDEVREIIEKVKYAPMNGKYKVYIIDEVHMMTSSAFNALLKTLEEPPEYCIFILATTEPHKVLPTIISRCQRFDFKKISSQKIAENLARICKKEKIKCTDEALNLISELADGGMRDSLSILDQCTAYCQDEITADDVSEVYGVASSRDKLEIFDLINEKNAKKLVEKVDSMSEKGIDMQRLTLDLINIAKEGVIYSYSKDDETLKNLNVEQICHLLKLFNPNQLLSFIDYLMESQSKYRDATNTLTYFQVALLKMFSCDEAVKMPVSKLEPVIRKEKANVLPQDIVLTTHDNMKTHEYKNYTDEQFYQIMINANKQIKSQDVANIEKLDCNNNNLLKILKSGIIFAASNDEIIVAYNTRDLANEVNEINNNKAIKDAINKSIIAITFEERDYLSTYFKSKQQEKATVKQEETVTDTGENNATNKLEKLFGKDGFDVVGE